MTNYRDPAPAPAPDAAPSQGTLENRYPFGYGEWRCPMCGSWFPSPDTSVLGPAHSGILSRRHLGCGATWYTDTLEVSRRRQRLIRPDPTALFAGAALIFFSLTIIYYFSGTQ